MLTAYLAALGFGVVLIGASVILGGHDHDMDGEHDFDVDKDIDFADAEIDIDADVDVDIDADVDADHDVDGDHDHDHDHDLDPVHELDHVASDAPHGVERRRWVPFFSMRFWTYALGSGGAVGSVLTLLGLATVVHLPAALGSGLVLGWGAAWSFRKLKHATADSTVRPATLRGVEAKVALPIRPGQRGKITLHIQGQRLELLARSREDRVLQVKEPVLIVAVKDDTAIVTPVPLLTTTSPN